MNQFHKLLRWAWSILVVSALAFAMGGCEGSDGAQGPAGATGGTGPAGPPGQDLTPDPVAEAIAEGLSHGGSVQVLPIERLSPADLNHADLVVMGSPTHNMKLPQPMRSMIADLPRVSLKHTGFAAFDTSYRLNAILARFTAAKRLDRKLRKLGGIRLVPPETFFVSEREGPLEDGEIERAGVWAEVILSRNEEHSLRNAA